MKRTDCSIFSPTHQFLTACLSLLSLFTVAMVSAVAQNIYVAQNSAGAATGADAADAYPISWLDTSGAWGSGAGQVGPGVTVHLVGAITSSGIQIQNSGTAGNPITIKFEPGAYISSPCQAGAGTAISANQRRYIVIDGGGTNNGAIFCTANGFGLANGSSTGGIALLNCSYVTVQNLAVTNMYVPVQNQQNVGNGIGVWIDDGYGSGCSNVMVTNCLFHDEAMGVSIAYGPNFNNITITGCTAYNCNWGGNAGDNGPTALLNGLTVSNCHFYNWQSWDDPTDANHHNGFYVWAMSGGFFTNVTFEGNIVGPGYGIHQTSGFYCSGNAGSTMVNNNVFNGTDGTAPSCAFIYLYPSPAKTCIVEAFNNTIVGGGAGTAISIGAPQGGTMPVYQVTNNLIENVKTAVVVDYYPANEVVREDYDLIYNVPVGSMFMWATTTSAGPGTVADWQGQAWEQHLQQGNPLLNNSFVPQSGSPAIGAGANLSQIFTTDAAGTLRPSAWTIGAYEPSSTPLVGGGPVAWNANLQAFAIQAGSSISTNSQGGSSDGATNVANGLVAWWPLDDLSGADSSGNGNVLNYPAGATVVTGEISNAVSFNGVSQFGVSTLTNLVFSSGTVTWWQNPSTTYNAGTTRVVWGQLTSGTETPAFTAQVGYNNNWYVGWNTAANDTRVVVAATSANYAVGAWNFYALTWSPLGTGFLMNGVQIATNSATPTVSNVANGFCIGDIGSAYAVSFPGALDDVRIYNRVLSPGEIADQYQWR
jgi:hypothetical protein